jgi:putative peptidoglycan lipid II flippase
MQFPLGLFGVAIASATLPSISRSVAVGNMDEYRRTLSRSLGVVFLLTLPSSIGLIVLGKSMIGAIYEGGRFSVYDTNQTAAALSCYALGLAGYSALKVVAPAFYALNDARTPMLVSVASIVLNYFAASYMSAWFGFAGLALSTSATALFGAIVLFLLLRQRTQGVYGRDLMSSTLRIVAASVAMGVVVYASNAWITGHLPARRLTYLADLAVSVPLGVAVFYAACRALRVSELGLVARAIPLSGRLRRTDSR